MGLRLEIISRHKQSLGERSTKEFGPNGGTIGRSLESDWVLPDGQRYLSSRHASVDYRAGSYYIIDTSRNGVYVNGADKPVGRGNPQRLFTNDRIRIGEYVIRVEIDDSDSTGEQLAEVPHIDPVDTAMHVEAPDVSTQSLVDEHEITGVGIDLLLDDDQPQSLQGGPTSTQDSGGFDLSNLSLEDAGDAYTETRPDPSAPMTDDEAEAGQAATSGSGAQPAAEPSRTEPSRTEPSRASGPAPATPQAQPRRADPKPAATGGRPAPAAASGGNDAALNAFLTGAGLEPQDLEQRDVEQLMHTLGRVMRETITGLTESLHLRAVQKSTLKQSNTTIQARDNNPLKFKSGVDESLQALLFGASAEYMPPVDSVRDAFRDVKLHQQTLLRALYKATERYIARLDPDQVEEQFSNGRRSSLLGATNKLKYWDYYKDLYLVVAQHATGELPAQFLEELAQAYDEEMGKADDQPAAEPRTGTG